MDMSMQYVKMCEEAEEIQKLWAPKLGDFIWGIPDSDGEPVVSVCVDVDYSGYEEFGVINIAVIDLWGENEEIDFEWWDKEKLTWLPRQDQLQEILKNWDASQKKLNYFYDFCKWFMHNQDTFNDNVSFEQLWLAFVMLKKYNKVWSKRKWVKIKNRQTTKTKN